MELKQLLGFAKQDLKTPELDEKIIKANEFLTKARGLEIIDDSTRDTWKEINSRIFGKMKLYEAEIKLDIKSAEAPVIRLKKKRDALLKPTDLATKIVAQKILDYDDGKKKIREAEEKKKWEEAEAERQRLQKIEDEKAERIAEEKRQAALDKAAALDDQGQGAAAEIMLQEAEEVTAEPVAVALQEPEPDLTIHFAPESKQEGRKDWEVAVLNIDLVPNEYVKKEIKLGIIKKKLSDTGGKINIPGLSWKEKKSAVRG